MDPYATVQTIERNTYDLQENLYVRIVGPYNIDTPFTLDVTVSGGVCGTVQSVPDNLPLPTFPAGSYQTLILTDSNRLSGTDTEKNTALTDLNNFAARSDVNGKVVDLSNSTYARVAFANAQADGHLTCAFARNTVADEIKKVADAFHVSNPSLQYIVLAGAANVIPFFQVQDVAGLADEKDYVVPVAPSTASEAGLKTNLVQGQDAYGSQLDVTQAGHTLAFPGLAVGRLVDTASDISTAINTYIQNNGVIVPHHTLVTGYDFVGDAAQAIKFEMDQGTNSTADTLIQNPGLPPTDPSAWTATQLRTKLVNGNFDIAMLSGHFSAGSLLAADYTTQLTAADIFGSTANFNNDLILALGCHGGYTIPSPDLLANASPTPDWAKAFLRKGAAGYISATGYAYGDTELTSYGERLFVLMAQQLRTGSGPVAIGKAVMEAKRQYLAETPQLTGIDLKTITEMTLYGLPMMKVDMPGARIQTQTDASIVGATDPVNGGPGASVGLKSAAVTLNPIHTDLHTKTLENLSDNSSVTTTYLSGEDGVVANPFEPIYPKEIHNVSANGQVLRGVALRGGSYADNDSVIPLTSSPTTETSTAHLSYSTDVFYPTQTWMANYFDTLAGGSTNLMVIPAQFRSRAPGAIDGTLRTFTNLSFQLYYLPGNWASAGSPETKAAAVSASPSIQGASATENSSNNSVTFHVNATADGSAGVQAVWVLYTGVNGSSYHGTWAPLDLVRDANDPTLWQGTLNLQAGESAQNVLFMVQAVGGAGLTTLATNLGAYYSVKPQTATPPPPPAGTIVTLQGPASGTYLKDSSFTISLQKASGGSLGGQLVTLNIGGQQVSGITNASGNVTLTIRPVIRPGDYTAQASFRGNASYLASNAVQAFALNKDRTTLTVTPASATIPVDQATPFVGTVRDSSGNVLSGKSVFFVVHNSTNFYAASVIADYRGNAALGHVSLPPGTYTVDAYFNGTIPLNNGSSLTLSDDFYESSSRTGLSLTLVGDTTPPTITATAVKADNTPYTAGTWTNQTVTVHFTCSDSGTGIASCPADQTFATDGTFTATGTATDNANNSASASFGPIQIDKTAPTLAPTVSPNPVYLNGTATATAGATDNGSGIATQSCGTIVTNTVGTKTVTCTATDNAGNTTTVSTTYRVIYRFDGFLQPINDTNHTQVCGSPCVVSIFRGGSTVPVKFQLKDADGNIVQAGSLPIWVTPVRGNRTSSSVDESVYSGSTTSGSNYRWDSTLSQYIFNWGTRGFAAGYYWRIGVQLDDGQTYYVNVGLN
jgi:hypothetical protein